METRSRRRPATGKHEADVGRVVQGDRARGRSWTAPRRTLASLAAVAVAALGSVVAAPAASAQECAGTATTSLTSAALPGGTWSVTDGCLTSDLFYEYRDGDAHARAALATVTYDDGHVGRVAVGTLTFGTGIALGVVGVEDAATGLVKWSAVLAPLEQSGDRSTVVGPGVTLFPTEAAEVSVSIAGTGTDARVLLETPPTVPDTSVVPDTTLPTESTVAPPSESIAPSTTAPAAPSTTVPAAAPSSTTTAAPPTTVAAATAPDDTP